MDDTRDTQQFLDKVKTIHQSFTPAQNNNDVFARLESELPAPNNPLAASGQPFITDAKQLADPLIMDEFSRIVQEIIAQDNVEEALRAISLLEDTLLPLYPSLVSEEPEYYRNYQQLLVLLKFVAIRTLSLTDIENLVKKDLITVLQQSKIRIQNKFQEVLDVYDDMILEGKIAEILANAMLAAEQKLSKDYLIAKGKGERLQGNVGNFLKDYQIFTLPVRGQTYRVSSVERLAYLNQDPNSRGLSKEDREILLGIFGIYDWLRFGQSELMVQTEEPVYLKRERLVVPSAPKPTLPSHKATEGAARVMDELTQRTKEQKSRVLPPAPRPPGLRSGEAGQARPPVPEVRSPKSDVGLQKSEERPLSRPLPRPGERGGSALRSPSSDLRVPQSDSEELYRKTLEELKRLRSQAPRNGKNIGRPPQAINEALIQASGKGKLLGEEAGRMGAGKNDQIQDSNLKHPSQT